MRFSHAIQLVCSFTHPGFRRKWLEIKPPIQLELLGRRMPTRLNTVVRIWLCATAVTLSAICPAPGPDTNSPAFSRDQIEFYEKKDQPLHSENCDRCPSHQADT